MKNENEQKFSFLIFKILRKLNWHSGTRIYQPTVHVKGSVLRVLHAGQSTVFMHCMPMVFF